MVIQAYVFLECAPGEPYDVVRALTQLPGVEMAHGVTGSYDVIAFVRVDNVADLGDLLSRRIHRLPGVLKTVTNVVVQEAASGGSMGSHPGPRA
jgi:DNA-binding Lrp family transcriptional regulator